MSDLNFHELSTPTLMRSARGAYSRSIRAHLHDIGVDDLPRNGAFILAGIDATGGPRGDLPGELGVTKQAVSQVIDTLVSRGYVERSPDTDDRRRINLQLTVRGRQVAEAVYAGVEAVDAQLREKVGVDHMEAMRNVMASLSEIKVKSLETGAGRRRPQPMIRHFNPIFPVRDLAAALAHYSDLGFKTFAYADGSDYGFANRDRTGIHLSAHPDHDAALGGAATYLYVRDADELYEQWSQPGIGGVTRPVELTEYQLREGSHTDPDGNLIRFGSPARSESES